MRTKSIFLVFLMIGVLFGFSYKGKEGQKKTRTDNPLIGKWLRIGHTGPISFDFKENGLVEGDFGNDQTIDVIAKYEIKNDTVRFTDKEGQMCQGYDEYKIYQTEYYLAFDLIKDNCGGRIKTTMGFWTKPNFKDFLTILDKEISGSPKQASFLNRARVYMAIGKPKQAKKDFDSFILNDTTNARAYINRAATSFPDDFKEVISDCNKAIALEPNNKNAYFLRGLAKYGLGDQEQGCQDFSKAIELGFSVLKIAEQEKCSAFWNKK